MRLLSDLETELPRRGCQATLDELWKLKIDVAEASRKLSKTIPQCLSTPYNQAWGEKLRRGALSDLVDKVKAAEQVPAIVKLAMQNGADSEEQLVLSEGVVLP